MSSTTGGKHPTFQRNLLCVKAQGDYEEASNPGLLGSKLHAYNFFVLAEGKFSWPGDLKEAGTFESFFFEIQNKSMSLTLRFPPGDSVRGALRTDIASCTQGGRQLLSSCASYTTVEKILWLPAFSFQGLEHHMLFRELQSVRWGRNPFGRPNHLLFK